MMKTIEKIKKWSAVAIAATLTMVMLGVSLRVSTVESANAAELGNGELTMNWSNEEGILDKPIASNTKETYKENDRQWLGLPSIARTENGRLWCAFQTGDAKEGSEGTNNYDVMYYSDDNGATWSEEYAIFDVADESIRLTDPRLFIDGDGTFWLVLIRGGAKGTYAIEIENPDCEEPSENLVCKKPILWLTYPPAHRPTILSNGLWTTPVEGGVKNQVTFVCNPDQANGTYVWREITQSDGKATTSSPDNKPYSEAQIIELKDGRLMMLSRLPKENGNGLEISYSDDFGAHWTPYEAGHALPLAGPSSKFHIQRLESGNILLLNHDSLSARHNITAWLSEDDGQTWPYKLLLDDRQIDGFWGVSYPEAAAEQGENGAIYVVYDAGRYTQKEIRLCIITEEDIKAGEPVSDVAKMRLPVVKSGGFTDILSVSEETLYDRYRHVEIGTAKSDIVSELPTSVQVTDENGLSYVLNGEWTTSDYNGNEAGRYTFMFSTTDLPEGVQDGYSLLNVYIGVGTDDPKTDGIIGENSSSSSEDRGQVRDEGCNNSVSYGLAGLSILTATAVLIKKKKEQN